MEQRVGAVGDTVMDHEQLLDGLVSISGQLTSLQEQLQGVVFRQKASLEEFQGPQRRPPGRTGV